MKRGDLVKFDTLQPIESQVFLKFITEEMFNSSGVIVSNVYEGQTSSIDAVTGKVYAIELIPVVDIMILGKIITEIPVRYLRRISANEQS